MPAIFSGNIETRILTPEFSMLHASTGIPAITIKIARLASAHENQTGTKTSTIAASIGERFHPLPHQIALHRSQHIDLYAEY
ncbi:hypothetical protein [Burkholderia sp. SCN-KJ]|uniref:hypothetical protein n=1 Tax=Burkholderia sp. SCN-KJ TaxID=2969248 RepID=UPI0021506443|nr:hypothetical protein [Burkholderia sp. SCN-KJ]MCR4465026.1 hypothetical protein [Burkholderia sp. SCN-KJ]